MPLVQQTKEHVLPMIPLRSQEEFEAGKGPESLRSETHHWAGEVGFPEGKSWCAPPARGRCVSEMSPCGQGASARARGSCCSGESPCDASLLPGVPPTPGALLPPWLAASCP